MTSAAKASSTLELSRALFHHIEHGAGDTRDIETVLAAGASVDAFHELGFSPLMLAALTGNLEAALLLISKGANLDAQALGHVKDRDGNVILFEGGRALHCAVFRRHLLIVRALLEAGADPNSTDNLGVTPLIVVWLAKKMQPGHAQSFAVELLTAGADPALASEDYGAPLHFAVGQVSNNQDHTDFMDMLLVRAPETLNLACRQRGTPLCVAATHGSETWVSKLLSAGAKEPPTVSVQHRGVVQGMDQVVARLWSCPLAAAVRMNHQGVVRVLLDRGMDAIGGLRAIPDALAVSIATERPRILKTLLDIEGEERRAHWACQTYGTPLLHVAVRFGNLTVTNVLLANGADTGVVGANGTRAIDVIGLEGGVTVGNATKDAIRRSLQRGPAFRARSWEWPMVADVSGTSTAGSVERGTRDDASRNLARLGVRANRLRSGRLRAWLHRYVLKTS